MRFVVWVLLWWGCSSSSPDWEVVGGKLMHNGKNVRVQGVSIMCTEYCFPGPGDCYGCGLVGPDRKANEHLHNLTKWNTQIVRIPVNSQWYLWDQKTPYPKGPTGCNFTLWEGWPTAYGPWSPAAYREWIDDHVKVITNLGMIAIIDLHWSDMEGTACCTNTNTPPCYKGCQQQMADKKSIDFWTIVAKRYANRMDVWFQLYNEPTYSMWGPKTVNTTGNTNIPYIISGVKGKVGTKNGCPPSPLTDDFTYVGLQDLYNTVRMTGADNIVLAGGADWDFSWNGLLAAPRNPDPSIPWCWADMCFRGCGVGSEGIDLMIEESPRGEGYPAPVSWSKKRWGKNIIYDTHPYQGKGWPARPSLGTPCSSWMPKAIQGASGQTSACSESCGFETAYGYLTKYVPVIATETAPCSGCSCDGSFITCQLEYFDSKGISFTPWVYFNASGCNLVEGPTWNLTGFGVAVSDFMTRHPPPYLVPH